MSDLPQPPEPLRPLPPRPVADSAPLPYTPVAAPPPGILVTQGLAITALAVGSLAFLNGWLPLVGIVLGIPAVVIGGLALGKGQRKRLALTGLVLGAIAALSSVLATIALSR